MLVANTLSDGLKAGGVPEDLTCVVRVAAFPIDSEMNHSCHLYCPFVETDVAGSLEVSSSHRPSWL